jgi:hypothetical protein
MNEDDFREAIWAGLGRAIFYARGHDVTAFRDIILDACLHCHAVDPQSEGTRAPYMVCLVQCTPEREFYRDKVLQSLRNSGDDWDTVHRFRFASILAIDGDERARQAMYEHFKPGPRYAESTGADFVQMDGLDGLLFAAEKVGELLMDSSNEVDQGSLAFHAIDNLGEEQVLSALREAGKNNSKIERYRQVVEADLKKDPAHGLLRNDFENLTYPRFRQMIPEPSYRQLSRWGEHANDEDLELAARDLRAAQPPDEQLNTLRTFRHRAFPLNRRYLVELAAGDEEQTAEAAAEALANTTHPSIRELAFRLIETRRPGRPHAISMLSQNWKPGDHEIALRWFEEEEDRDARHRLGIDLRNFWERHPDPATEVNMLLTLYEKGPCSRCREFVLDRLIELGALPDAIRAECTEDANEDIRKLMAKDE